jgi:hypothetical protein
MWAPAALRSELLSVEIRLVPHTESYPIITDRLAEYRMVSPNLYLLKMEEPLHCKILKGKGVWW